MYEKICDERTAYLSELLESILQLYIETYEVTPLCIYMHPNAYLMLEEEWGREPVNFMGIPIELNEHLNLSSIFVY
jgi:hypothetical protein